MSNGKPSLVTRVFAIIGMLVTGGLALVLVCGTAVRCACSNGGTVRARTVLELDLTQPLADGGITDPVLALLERDKATLVQLLETLERATKDDRVVGLVADVGATAHGLARTQELRDAILRFRAAGKFAVAYAIGFGEFGNGNQGYYLATAFDEIWLQPTGGVGWNGLYASATFLRGALDKVGVEPEFGRRRNYKTAVDQYTERRFTPENRETVEALLGDAFGQLVAGIAGARGLSEARVRELADRGPFTGPEALEHGLVDGLAYRDEVLAKVKARAGEHAELLFARRYRERTEALHRGTHAIALIHGIGPIVQGRGGVDPLAADRFMGSDELSEVFQSAIASDDIEAIVFRVDSPGGSAIASDAIWRQTVRARAAGKPVIVSMGNVAGSGGYYVAAGADKIVAEPGTITGSIGVYAGKPYVRELWNRLGVTFDSVATSENAEMFSLVERFDASGRERLEAFLDRVYVDFKQRVSDGRGLSAEAVEAVAQGRVWSGARAKELGLVDELGGLETAVRLAAEAIGTTMDEVRLVELPKPKNVVEAFLAEDRRKNSEEPITAAELRFVTGVERLRPLVRELAAAGLLANEGGTLSMTPLELGP